MTVRFLGGVAERRRRFAFGPAPTFKQDFVTGGGGALPQGATFSRGTIGTLYNQSGLVAYAPSNLLMYSEQFDNANWFKNGCTINQNVITAPDSTINADALVEDGTTAEHRIYQNLTTTSAPTFSVYAKAGTRTWAFLEDFSGTKRAWFDLANGVLGTVNAGVTASITNVGNGWYRCVASINTTNTVYLIHAASADNTAAYTGINGNTALYIWGAQLEQGSNATTYTPTTTAAVYGPRFDYDPNNVLQQNLFVYSNTFTNASWVKNNTTVGITSALAPDGTNTATYVMNTVGLGSYIYQQVSSIFLPSTTYIRSFYAQLIVSGSGIIYSEIGGGIANASFNLSTGVATPAGGSTISQSMTPVGNGWYYCTHAFTSSATPSLSLSSVNLYLNSYGASANAQSIGLWNQNVNIGSTALPYLATTSTTQAVCAPRGLLIEEARTNLCTYSNQFDNAAYTKGNITVTANVATSPDGTTNANSFIRGASNTIESNLRITTTQAISTAYTLSVYAKAGTAGAYLYLRNLAVDNAIPSGVVVFNLANGTIVSNGSSYPSPIITSVGNGWYRCVISGTTPASIANNLADFGVCNAANSVTGNSGDTIYIYGAQFEAGAFATSYIPTTSATVTRNADSATVPTGTWYNTAQGTVLAQFDTNALVTTARIIGTQNAAAFLSLPNSTGSVSIFDGTNIIVSTLSVNTPTKAASTYVGSTLTICMSGGTPASGTGAGTFPFSGTTTLGLGSSNNGTSLFLNGHIRSFSYYNYALTNAQLQQVTT